MYSQADYWLLCASGGFRHGPKKLIFAHRFHQYLIGTGADRLLDGKLRWSARSTARDRDNGNGRACRLQLADKFETSPSGIQRSVMTTST